MSAYLTTPWISVVTPVHNGGEYVGECMRSVASSCTGAPYTVEHIIVDDGSADATIGTVEQSAAAFANAKNYIPRLLRLPHCGKPGQVRNCGIAAANGKYIFFLDHDDVLLQQALRHLAAQLESASGEIVYGDFLRCDASLAYTIGDDYAGMQYENTRSALCSLFKGEHFFQHSFMVTKRLLEQVSGYDERITFGEDFDLCVRFILAGHMPLHVPVTTHFHRNHSRNLTAGYAHDRYSCPIWLAEHRAHYFKHSEALNRYLDGREMFEIMKIIGIAEDSPQCGPPDKDYLIRLDEMRVSAAKSTADRQIACTECPCATV